MAKVTKRSTDQSYGWHFSNCTANRKDNVESIELTMGSRPGTAIVSYGPPGRDPLIRERFFFNVVQNNTSAENSQTPSSTQSNTKISR